MTKARTVVKVEIIDPRDDGNDPYKLLALIEVVQESGVTQTDLNLAIEQAVVAWASSHDHNADEVDWYIQEETQ